MAVRYLSSNKNAVGNGSSPGAPAAMQNINTMIGQAGPGGEVRMLKDGTYDWVGLTINLTNGGTLNNRVKVYGVSASDGVTPDAVIFTQGRTSPWPKDGAQLSANPGGTMFTYSTAASYIHWDYIHHLNCGFCHLVNDGATPTGVAFGAIDLFDSISHQSMLDFRATYGKWDRAKRPAINAARAHRDLVRAFYNALTTEQKDRLLNSIKWTNVNRPWDNGSSSSTTSGWKDFLVVGGTITGTSKGARFRGLCNNCIVQDTQLDAEKQQAWLPPGQSADFSIGFECSGNADNVHFIRTRSDNNWYWDPNGGYTNGDGYTAEKGNFAITWSCVDAHYNNDGGIDTKAKDYIMFAPRSTYCRRILRNWGLGDAYDVELANPKFDYGGSACAVLGVYENGEDQFIRINSGSVTYTTGYSTAANACVYLVEGNGTIWYNSEVTYPGKPGNLSLALGTGYIAGFSPDDTAPPAFSSNPGTLTTPEGVSKTYTPTYSKGGRIYRKPGDPGADSAKFAVSNAGNYVRLNATFMNPPGDADGDNTYTVNIRAYRPTGQYADQTVNVTITPAVVVKPNIITRMGANAPTDQVLIDKYNEVNDAIYAAGLHAKIEKLQFSTHNDLASRINWAAGSDGGSLGADGTRPFPQFLHGRGYKISAGKWCYLYGGLSKYVPAALSAFVFVEPTLATGDIMGRPNNAISCNAGNAVIRANNNTPLTVPNAFKGDGFFGFNRVDALVEGYTDGEKTFEATQTGLTSVSAANGWRYGTRPDVSGIAPTPIFAAGYGYALNAAEWEALYEISNDFKQFMADYFASKPPQIVSQPAILGIVAVSERLQALPGVYNKSTGITRNYVWKVDGVQVGVGDKYQPLLADAHKTLTVTEYATDANGTSEANTSPGILIGDPIPSYYLAPTAMGTGDGSTPDNARLANNANLNNLMSLHDNARFLFRADQGDYTATFQLAQTNFIIDSYHPIDLTAKANFTGGRPFPYPGGTGNNGSYIFTLLGGWGNAVFRNLHLKNMAMGIIATGVGNGLTVSNVSGSNVYRLVDLSSTLTITNFLLEDLYVENGIERQIFRVGGDSSIGVVRRCYADGDFIDDEPFPSLYCVEGTAHDIHFEDCEGKNVFWTPDLAAGKTYYNGDIFEISSKAYNITYLRCKAKSATDGCFDLKTGIIPQGATHAVTLEECEAEAGKINYRHWYGAIKYDRCISKSPHKQAGSGTEAHFGFFDNGGGIARKCTVIDPVVTSDPGQTCPIFNLIEGYNYYIEVIGTSGIEVLPTQKLVNDDPSRNNTIIFNPPVPGHDIYGKRLDGSDPDPQQSRDYGPYKIRVTDANDQVAEATWSPTMYSTPGG